MGLLYPEGCHRPGVKSFLLHGHHGKLLQEIISATYGQRPFLTAKSEPAHIRISSDQFSSVRGNTRAQVGDR